MSSSRELMPSARGICIDLYLRQDSRPRSTNTLFDIGEGMSRNVLHIDA